MAKLAASAYGQALYELAIESGSAAGYLDEVQIVLEAFKENSEFTDFLNNPKISKTDKVKTMESIFDSRVRKDITGLIVLAVEKDRQSDITGILDFFVAAVKDYLRIGIVNVTTPMELSDKQKADVEKRILDTTGFKKLEMNYSIDKSLIGGMVIRIGDRVVDTSIKTKLAELTKELNKLQLA